MSKRIILCFVPPLVVWAALWSNSQTAPSSAQSRQEDKRQLPPAYVPPGRQMYKEYCAACHGSDGKGRGPVAASLRKRPPDLTTLAKRHGGNFPEEYVTHVLRFGPGFSAHGSSEMPVWGPIFQDLENYNEAAVRQRIKNLCEYLESIQEK
jgi:mono/diheme cytochrome c family protein